MKDRIELVRISTNLGKTAFAKTINVSQSAYDRYERGSSAIPAEVYCSIVRVYGIHIDWLLLGEGGNNVKYKREFIEKDKYDKIEERLRDLQDLLILCQTNKISEIEKSSFYQNDGVVRKRLD